MNSGLVKLLTILEEGGLLYTPPIIQQEMNTALDSKSTTLFLFETAKIETPYFAALCSPTASSRVMQIIPPGDPANQAATSDSVLRQVELVASKTKVPRRASDWRTALVLNGPIQQLMVIAKMANGDQSDRGVVLIQKSIALRMQGLHIPELQLPVEFDPFDL